MSPEKIDCALIFAIEEEFNIIKEFKNTSKISDTISQFEFLDRKGLIRTCAATYVSVPGFHEGYKYLDQFYKDYDPHVVYVIGISGQIDEDMKIGDICIADSVDKYDYNSKQKDGQIRMSGKTIELNYNALKFSHLANSESVNYKKWQNSSFSDFDMMFSEDQKKQLVSKDFIKKNKTVQYRYGKIACGESVVDDPVLKKAIQDKDRKILCVDMESFGFADASKGRQVVIIRAISDTADGRKKELDNFGGQPELLRKWALRNAFQFFNNIILGSTEFPQNDLDRTTREFRSNNVPYVDALIEEKGASIFPTYSRLFHHIIDSLESSAGPDKLFEALEENLFDLKPRSIFLTQGYPGTGKSTFLYLLHRFLNRDQPSSVFFNLHDYKKSDLVDAAEKFIGDVNLILHGPTRRYLIIDGVDQYERFFSNRDIRLTPRILSELQQKFDVIVLGITNQDYSNEEDEDKQYYIPEPKFKLKFKNFFFDVKNIESLVADLLRVNKVSGKYRKDILYFLDKTGLKDLDWYTTNMLIQKLGNFNYIQEDKNPSVGGFFFNYLRETFANESEAKPIKIASEIAFKKLIKEEQLTADQYKSPFWRVVQGSSTIKQFLISEHLVNLYSNLDTNFENSKDDLEHIYSYKINTYFKDNINRSQRTQDKIFNSVTKRYRDLGVMQRPNVCYILGRLEEPILRSRGRRFLAEQLEEEFRAYKSGSYRDDETMYRQHLLLIRTIYISLSYLGDSKAAQAYLSLILSDQEWDDLNRGFHLEYYGDIKYNPQKQGLHNDLLDVGFSETFGRLSKKILDALNGTKVDNLNLGLEVQTVVSLALNRHLHGKLDSQLQSKIIDLLSKYRENDIWLHVDADLRAYVDASNYILSMEKASISSILRDVYKIKKVRRSGWNFSGEIEGNVVVRVIKEPESVPEHVFAALIIALLFLPETLEGDSSYNKLEVIQTLLIHDLAEAFTGDIRTFEKTDAKRKLEDEKMKMLFSWQTINGFSNLNHYKKLWNDFRSQNTTTARVAKEIDKLEQLFQLNLYKNQEDNTISDFITWQDELVKQIETKPGKSILQHIIK